ncbi:MAG: ATP-binding protein, partial [Flavisolibacter sp.]
MIFKDFQWRVLIRVLLLFITLTAASFFLVRQLHIYLALVAPLLVYQLFEFLRFQKKTHDELNEFVEAVHY